MKKLPKTHIMRTLLLFVWIFLCISMVSHAQVGIGTMNPDATASLELSSSSKGLLINRMTEAQREAISAPATGLMVYQTDGDHGFWFWDGSQWQRVAFLGNGGGMTHNYGIMNNYNNGGDPIVVSGQYAVWTKYLFVTDPDQLIIFANGEITVTPGATSNIVVDEEGIYNVMANISLLNASQANAVDFTIFKNGVELPYLSVHFNIPNGTDNFGTGSISSIVSLSEGDYIDLRFKQLVSGVARTFEVSSITFSLVRYD